MKRGLRMTLFWFFALAFFVLAPAAVFYTAGYRISPQTGRIVRSGSISISTSPRAADIIFNDEEFVRDTPYIFKRVLPGKHKIELKKTGYLSWSSIVTVEPNMTSSIEGAQLLKDGSDMQVVLENASSLMMHPNRDIAAYVERAENWIEIWQIDLRSGTRFMKGRVRSFSDEQIELTWSHVSEHVTLRIGTEVYVMQHDGVIDTLTIPSEAQLYWHPQYDQVVIVNGVTATTYPVESDGFSASSLLIVSAGSQLIEFSPQGDSVRVYRLEEGERRLIAELSPDMLNVRGVIGEYIIIENASRKFVVLNVSQNASVEFEARADALVLDLHRTQLVYSDGFAIFTYDLQNKRETFYIREGRLVEHIFPAEQYIIYGLSEGDWYALERDIRGETRNYLALPWGNETIENSRLSQSGGDIFLQTEEGTLLRIGVYR